MSDKPVKAIFNPLSEGLKRHAIRARQSDEMETRITVIRGYTDLEEFIEEFGEVDEFHNINQAILAFLGDAQ